MKTAQPLFDPDAVRESVLLREEAARKDAQNKDYNFVSASLTHLFPEWSPQRHEAFFREMLFYRAFAVTQSYSTEALKFLRSNGNQSFLASIAENPVIFCLYHIGSYRAPIGWMFREHINFVLLLDARTLREQHGIILQLFASLQEQYNSRTNYRLINVEEPASLFSIAEALRQKMCVVAYLDGNTGLGGVYNNTASRTFSFMNVPFHSRLGIATLSHAVRRPVIPACCYFTSENEAPVIHFGDPVLPKQAIEKNESIMLQTLQLYDFLATQLRERPAQWEAWLYVHKFFDMAALRKKYPLPQQNINDKDQNPEFVFFNHQNYGMFKVEEKCYLFYKLSYSPFSIDASLYSLLEPIAGSQDGLFFSKTGLSKQQLTGLLEKKILLTEMP